MKHLLTSTIMQKNVWEYVILSKNLNCHNGLLNHASLFKSLNTLKSNMIFILTYFGAQHVQIRVKSALLVDISIR